MLLADVVKRQEFPCEGINVAVGHVWRIAVDSRHASPRQLADSSRPGIDKIT
jgi:hypothetical protein